MINLKKLPNHQRDEKTELFLRRHWIEILQLFGYAFLLVAIPVVIIYFFNLLGVELVSHPTRGPLISLFLAIYFFLVFIITITQFTDYYLDTWIVTNERIINIEQEGLFSRIVSELHLNQVQDVTSETHGIMGTVLTYGDVYIQTAGTRERFNFKNVDNPELVKQRISKLIEEDKVRHGDASSGLGIAKQVETP